jgi:thioredoxin
VASERRLLLGVLLILALVLPVGAWALDRARQHASSDDTPAVLGADSALVQSYPPATAAPALRLTTLDGGTLDLAAYRGRPVLLNFWATWCGPCKAIAPLLDQLANEHAGKLRVTKLNVDENQGVTQRFNVRSIPSVLFFRDGRHVDTVVGAVPKATLQERITKHLG